MSEQTNANPDDNRQRHILLKLFIALIVVALAFGGYFGLNLIANQIDTKEAQVEQFATELKQLHTKYAELQNNLQDLQNFVQKFNIAKAKNWRPVFIEHLIRMADLTLNTTSDTKLALSFLLVAKQYASTPELSTIAHALNKNIADLQTVPAIDSASLVLKIEALNQKINVLPMIVQQFNASPQPKLESGASTAATLWQRFFVSTTRALKDIVVIRRQVVEPLLSPEQETIVRLNVQTKLLQAELAVMNRQNALYHSCLDATTNLIIRYFVASQITNTDILPILKELQAIDLQPKLPLITESIVAIQNFMSTNNIQEEISQGQPALSPAKDGKST